MNVILNSSSSIEFKKTTKNGEVKELSDKLEIFFKSRDYRSSIKTYIIGVIYVHPNFDPFFKVEKPSYIEDEERIFHGVKIHVHKSFTFSIKLNFHAFLNSTREEGLRMIAGEIMKTLLCIKYPKNIVDFDSVVFYKDIEEFFKSLNLI